MPENSNNIAGVVLAAGGSTRLGRPKALLDWKGESIVRAVVKTALAVGLHPVQVVLGAVEKPILDELADLPVNCITNNQWEIGMSSSVRMGISSLPDNINAAVFLLVDQPHLTANLIKCLINSYIESRAIIVAPQVGGKRANPVLFDRALFDELKELKGDTGGRAIMSKHEVTWLPWEDTSILEDIDTEEDYKRLLGIKA